MKHQLVISLASSALIAMAVPASAGGTFVDHGTPSAGVFRDGGDMVLRVGAKHCPPGLAKKNNGCNPPGQAKHRYRVGDRINGGYDIIHRPGRYGLDPDESYFRVGDYVYRVDRKTREVLDLIGAIAAVLD